MRIKGWICLLFLTGLSLESVAQEDEAMRKRIESYRAQFLTERLDLQPEEAQKFWPVYNQYRKELRHIQGDRREDLWHRPKNEKPLETLTEKEAEQLITTELKRQRDLLDLREEYYRKFKTVIPVQKIALLYKSEIDFQRKLLQRLSKKRHKRSEGVH